MSIAEPEVMAVPKTQHGGGDSEMFAHYVDKSKIVDASVFGSEIEALCGKRWIPSRDPNQFPICPECKSVYSSLPPGV